MNVCIPLACSVVAAAAAVRSTWSPCGLSMLSTITPFSERAKGHSYLATSTWFVAGATTGGASLGLVMASSALAVRELHPTQTVVGAVALVATLVAAVSDSGVTGLTVPFHRRQVNERWLDQFRPSVYGIGFGWQIGTGLATYITSAAVYLMIVLGALTGRPVVALTVGTCFGMLRGTAVLLTRRVTDPSGLRAFHRRFVDVGPMAGRMVLGVELGSAAVIALSFANPVADAVALVAAVAVTVAAALIPSIRSSGHRPDWGDVACLGRMGTPAVPSRPSVVVDARTEALDTVPSPGRPVPVGAVSAAVSVPVGGAHRGHD